MLFLCFITRFMKNLRGHVFFLLNIMHNLLDDLKNIQYLQEFFQRALQKGTFPILELSSIWFFNSRYAPMNLVKRFLTPDCLDAWTWLGDTSGSSSLWWSVILITPWQFILLVSLTASVRPFLSLVHFLQIIVEVIPGSHWLNGLFCVCVCSTSFTARV